jgi:imidazolonepropionase-like amidohydrolase
MPATVIVEEERISAVRGRNDVPPDAELIDFRDSVLLPGLVDSHVHILGCEFLERLAAEFG